MDVAVSFPVPKQPPNSAFSDRDAFSWVQIFLDMMYFALPEKNGLSSHP